MSAGPSTQPTVPVPPGSPVPAELNRKVGGACLIAGAVTFCTVRLLHGDTPAADPEAALAFVHQRPIYPLVHVTAPLAMLLTLTGLMALARSFSRPAAWLVGQSTVASALAGWAVFTVETTSEGLGLPVLADAVAGAEPGARIELVQAARAVATATYGPSLMAMALMIGLPLLLAGTAMVLDRSYPSWLGGAGALVGAATASSAVALFLEPDLFPGFLLYGVLASVLAQLWLIGLGVTMVRRRSEGTVPVRRRNGSAA